MNELFTSGSVGGPVGQPPALPGCKRATVQWEEAKESSKAPASAPAAKRYVRTL